MSETRCVALFSGINVGGNRIVKMAELRTFLEELGFSDVATYVQSGNAVFGARAKDAVALTKAVEDAFEKRWGFRSRIMVRDGKWFARLVERNPYPEAADDPTKLHAFVCERPPTEAEQAVLAARDTFGDRWVIEGDVLYLHAPNGIGKSKFVEQIPRALKVPSTARNWRTVLAIRAMLEG